MKSIIVAPAVDAQMSQLIPVVRAAHAKMGSPLGPEYTPERTLQLLAMTRPFPTTVLLLVLDGRRIVGYCWAEHVLDVRELHIHEIYLRGGYDHTPLYEALMEAARARGVARITAISFRDGTLRLASRFGFKEIGIALSKEVA